MTTENFPATGSDDSVYPMAADLVASAYYGYAKLVWGPDGSAYQVTNSTPMPVVDVGAGTLLGSINNATGSSTSYLAAVEDGLVATTAYAGAYQTGFPMMFIRDDELTEASGVPEGAWLPGRANSRGAPWVAIDTAFDAGNDSFAVGVRATLDGCDVSKNLDVDESEDAVKASPGNLYGFYFANQHATFKRYLKFYDATVANVTVGSTAPVLTFPLPPDSAGVILMPWPVDFSAAITLAATAYLGDSDATAIGANEVVVNTFYK